MGALAAIVSSVHLVALALGLSAVTLADTRSGPLDEAGLRRLFAADTVWGRGGLWVATSLLRAFGGLGKGTAFHLGSTLFGTKI
jgi:hypothetical protein